MHSLRVHRVRTPIIMCDQSLCRPLPFKTHHSSSIHLTLFQANTSYLSFVSQLPPSPHAPLPFSNQYTQQSIRQRSCRTLCDKKQCICLSYGFLVITSSVRSASQFTPCCILTPISLTRPGTHRLHLLPSAYCPAPLSIQTTTHIRLRSSLRNDERWTRIGASCPGSRT